MRFLLICDLLEDLERIATRDPPFLPQDFVKRRKIAVESWFRVHRRLVDDADGCALLSTMLPGKRPERVYNLQQARLEKVIGRILALPRSRQRDLERWRQPGAGDLADCVERVSNEAEMPLQAVVNQVSVREIDEAMSRLASKAQPWTPEDWSSKDTGAILCRLYLRLQARESKWLTRLILKDYAPVDLPEDLLIRLYHPQLPDLLKAQCELPAALSTLEGLLGSGADLTISAMAPVQPCFQIQLGTKIGRQPFFKARSINDCVRIAQNRRMSVERKYDGEYCQIHIDMSKSPLERIKIFSKSGRNSTRDRKNLHHSICSSLRLDELDCLISKNCILEGEMVVYSHKERKILDFYNIRKHVSRGRGYRGVEMDSRPGHHEYLMVVFFDIMLLDDFPVLQSKRYQRRQTLETIVRSSPGRVTLELAEYQLIDFSKRTAALDLRELFAKCITARREGLILRPADDPYFYSGQGGHYHSCCIKLKREYIGRIFREVGDFAVIGAAYNAQKAKLIPIPNLPWTDFYIGCLQNKADVIENDATPRFVVVTNVAPNKDILRALKGMAPISEAYRSDNTSLLIQEGVAQGKKPSVVFTSPLVFELYCFSFDREGNTGFWTLRFPQVSKVHFDRTYLDAVTFTELQELAASERSDIEQQDSQEDREWVKRLEAANLRGSTTDASSVEGSPASPPRRTLLIPEPIDSLEISQRNTARAPQHLKRKSLERPLAKCQLCPKRLKPSINLDHPRQSSAKISEHKSSMYSTMRQRRPLSEFKNISGLLNTTAPHSRPGSCVYEKVALSKTQRVVAGVSHSTLPSQHSSGLIGCSSSSENVSGLSVGRSRSTSLREGTQSSLVEQRSRVFIDCTFAFPTCNISLRSLLEKAILSHGGAVVEQPQEWLDGYNFPSYCKVSGNRIRKMLLVERNQISDTAEFLSTVHGLNLRRISGQREWVEVYDSGLLREVAHFETFSTIPSYILKRYWVGAV